jgi:hypothetical protein
VNEARKLPGHFKEIIAVVHAALFLAGMLAQQSLFAQIQSKSKNSSDQPTLTFPAFDPSKPLRIVAYGDMRFADPSIVKGTNPRIRRWLAERVAQENPGILLLTGDMPFTGSQATDWQDFQIETAPWRTQNILTLPTPGNHEMRNDPVKGNQNYLDNFPAINRHRYYSALAGNIEVISLDMNSPTGRGSDEARWFVDQLEHIPSQVQFLFILYHLPWIADQQSKFVADLPSRGTIQLREMLEARLPKIHAQVVVFNGHIHNYERFERKGVEYIVTGGGGAEPYPLLFRGDADLYKDESFPVYHYLTLDIANGVLSATMWKVKDPDAPVLSVEAMDHFTLKAPPSLHLKRKADPNGVH